jgi:hypothetical protein
MLALLSQLEVLVGPPPANTESRTTGFKATYKSYLLLRSNKSPFAHNTRHNPCFHETNPPITNQTPSLPPSLTHSLSSSQ